MARSWFGVFLLFLNCASGLLPVRVAREINSEDNGGVVSSEISWNDATSGTLQAERSTETESTVGDTTTTTEPGVFAGLWKKISKVFTREEPQFPGNAAKPTVTDVITEDAVTASDSSALDGLRHKFSRIFQRKAENKRHEESLPNVYSKRNSVARRSPAKLHPVLQDLFSRHKVTRRNFKPNNESFRIKKNIPKKGKHPDSPLFHAMESSSHGKLPKPVSEKQVLDNDVETAPSDEVHTVLNKRADADDVITSNSTNKDVVDDEEDEVEENIGVKKKVTDIVKSNKGSVNVHEVIKTKKQSTVKEVKDEHIHSASSTTTKAAETVISIMNSSTLLAERATTNGLSKPSETTKVATKSTVFDTMKPKSRYQTTYNPERKGYATSKEASSVSTTVGDLELEDTDTSSDFSPASSTNDQNLYMDEVVEKLKHVLTNMSSINFMRVMAPFEMKSDDVHLKMILKNSSLVLEIVLPLSSTKKLNENDEDLAVRRQERHGHMVHAHLGELEGIVLPTQEDEGIPYDIVESTQSLRTKDELYDDKLQTEAEDGDVEENDS